MFAAFDIWSFFVLVPLALATVTLGGFLILRRHRSRVDAPGPRMEQGGAKQTISELEALSQQVCVGLATHHATVLQFQERISFLSRQNTLLGGQQLRDEADTILQPTLRLASQITQAYETIQRHTNMLKAIGELRTDPLSGLSNRRALDESLRNHLAMFARYGNSFSIVLFDVDHFQKLICERGLVHGEQVLRQMGGLLRESVRETDLATCYGGGEFVLVLPETDLLSACVLAERVRATVEQQCGVTVSGGVAVASEDDVPKTLISRADAALYSAKSSGHNCVFRHDGRQIVAIPVGSHPLPADWLATIERRRTNNTAVTAG